MTVTAHQTARSRISIEELIDPHLAAQHIEELGNAVGDALEQHLFASNVAACMGEKGLRFLEILGKCAGNVDARIHK